MLFRILFWQTPNDFIQPMLDILFDGLIGSPVNLLRGKGTLQNLILVKVTPDNFIQQSEMVSFMDTLPTQLTHL